MPVDEVSTGSSGQSKTEVGLIIGHHWLSRSEIAATLVS
jgi:hypothetical protein